MRILYVVEQPEGIYRLYTKQNAEAPVEIPIGGSPSFDSIKDALAAADSAVDFNEQALTGLTELSSDAPDSDSARGFILDVINQFATVGAKQLILKNAGASFLEIYSNANSQTHIDSTAGALWLTSTGGTLVLSTGGDLFPFTDAGQSLGLTVLRWKDVPARTVTVGDAIGNRPAASVDTRGSIFLVRSTTGNPDVLQVCMKKTDDSYAWVDVVTAP